jgi:hypothetical protein
MFRSEFNEMIDLLTVKGMKGTAYLALPLKKDIIFQIYVSDYWDINYKIADINNSNIQQHRVYQYLATFDLLNILKFKIEEQILTNV